MVVKLPAPMNQYAQSLVDAALPRLIIGKDVSAADVRTSLVSLQKAKDMAHNVPHIIWRDGASRPMVDPMPGSVLP